MSGNKAGLTFCQWCQ